MLMIISFTNLKLLGGPEILTTHAGTDCTADFEEVFHSPEARKQLVDYAIGTIKGYKGDAANNGVSNNKNTSNVDRNKKDCIIQ